jgi:hypothetical protein
MLPEHLLTPDQLPALQDQFQDGWPPPIGYGRLSDESEAIPQGVVPGVYLADINLQDTFGGGAIDQDVLAIGFFGHAVQDTINLYYNDPDTPDLRQVVPFSEYGNNIWAPHKPGWSETGSAGQYIDFGGYRYTLVFINANIGDLAQAIRDRRVLIAGNFHGIEDVGDGTGALIESPARIFAHFWINFVDGNYTDGNWETAPPLFGEYSLLDMARIQSTHIFGLSIISGGLLGAILIGRDGRQQSAWEIVTEMCRSWDMDVGENHHGQIIADHEDLEADIQVSFNDQDDAIAFRTRRDRDAFATTIRYRAGYRYAPPSAPQGTPPEAEPGPVSNIRPYAQWASGLLEVESADALNENNGIRRIAEIEMYGTRHIPTADAVAARVLARAVGPENTGPVIAEWTTGVQGFGKEIETIEGPEPFYIDLNTYMGWTHAEGIGPSAFDAKRVRIMGVGANNPLLHTVTLEARVMPQLID